MSLVRLDCRTTGLVVKRLTLTRHSIGSHLLVHIYILLYSMLTVLFSTCRVCSPPDSFLIVQYSPLQCRPLFYDCATSNNKTDIEYSLCTSHEVIQLSKVRHITRNIYILMATRQNLNFG